MSGVDLDYFKRGLHKVVLKGGYNEVIRNKKRERYHTDLNFKVKHNLRSRIWNVLTGKSKNKSTEILLGCTIDELRVHIESQFKDNMSWENYGKWHIDHIRPCASFDLSDPEQQALCFHYTNLQPLWAKDNLSKRNKYNSI